MVYLIDASVFVFRAWYSIPADMTDPDRNPVNALYGFARFLGDFLEDVQPQFVAVAFDENRGASCVRAAIYPQYKANREPKAVCGIALGDVFDDLSLYDYYLDIISRIGIPMYHVPGNHDENYDVPHDDLSLETFKRYFGPNYYAFQYGKTHFIVLDDVEYKGQKENKYGGYQGRIGERQLLWLKNYLSFVPDDELIVFIMHIPFYTAAGEDPGIRAVDREQLFSLLQDRQHLLALAGHMHTIEHHFLKPEQGWKGTAPFQQIICGAMCGAWWSGPQDSRGDRAWACAAEPEVWIRLCDLLQMRQLFLQGRPGVLTNAINILSHRIAVGGVNAELLRLDPVLEECNSPFLALHHEVDAWLRGQVDDARQIDVLLDQCSETLDRVRRRSAELGTSIDLTLLSTRLAQQMVRLRTLVALSDPDTESPHTLLAALLIKLIEASDERYSVSGLIRDTTGRLASQITQFASQGT